MSLIRNGQDDNSVNGLKQHAAKIAVEGTPFRDVFGKDSRRKRVKLDVSGMEDMAQKYERAENDYNQRKQEETELQRADGEEETGYDASAELSTAREAIFSKGQSKRIWNELYKVVSPRLILLPLHTSYTGLSCITEWTSSTALYGSMLDVRNALTDIMYAGRLE